MDIRQFSVLYILDQDRILVRINSGAGEEVQMTLTRHMTLRLWPMLNRVVIDHLAIPADAKTDGYVDLAAMGNRSREILADLRRQEVAEKADFKTPYRNDTTHRPLGDTPLLVTEVNLTPKTDGVLQMNFKEILKEPASNRGFQLDMAADMVFGVIQLFHHALEQSQWLHGLVVPAAVTTLLSTPDELDFSPDATRPTYLN